MTQLPLEVQGAIVALVMYVITALLHKAGWNLPFFKPQVPTPAPVDPNVPPVQGMEPAAQPSHPLLDRLWSMVDGKVLKQADDKLKEVADSILGTPPTPKP